MELSKSLTIVSWILRILTAGILLQTLFFKFTAARESVYIFTQVGAEPFGRIASGILELIASVLILIPATVPAGAILALGVISGAIASHLFILGIALPAVDDKGELFALAIAVFVFSAAILYLHRGAIPFAGKLLR